MARVTYKSVPLPNWAKNKTAEARRNQLNVGSDPFHCVPEFKEYLKQRFRGSMMYQINAPYLNSLAYMNLFEARERQQYSFLFERSAHLRDSEPVLKSTVTVQLINDKDSVAACLYFFGVPDFLVEGEDWVIWKTEDFSAPPDVATHMVIGDRVIKRHRILGMGSVKIQVVLSDVPEVAEEYRATVEARNRSVDEHTVWVAQMRSFRTTKQLLDWDPNAFEYLPWQLKLKMQQ